jgi:hypothetical protein
LWKASFLKGWIWVLINDMLRFLLVTFYSEQGES